MLCHLEVVRMERMRSEGSPVLCELPDEPGRWMLSYATETEPAVAVVMDEDQVRRLRHWCDAILQTAEHDRMVAQSMADSVVRAMVEVAEHNAPFVHARERHFSPDPWDGEPGDILR